MNQQLISQKVISASLLRLRMRSLFFVPDFLLPLSPSQQDGLLLHEVLHAALLHGIRRGVRHRLKWNIAADIVVNGMIIQQGAFALPEGGVRDEKLEHLSVEEIYELLPEGDRYNSINLDLLDGVPGEGDKPGLPLDELATQFDSLSEAKKAELESHWRDAMQQATVIARTTGQGKLLAEIERELGSLDRSQLDWRSYLWRYLVKTPTDYLGYDRRFIGRDLYLETLQGESVKVYVAVDTSGSINNQRLKMFLSEVQGILSSYPHLECELYYADAAIYGPHELNPDSQIPSPQGGGGTSFIPFFDRIAENWSGMETGVCVYLTDRTTN